MTSPLLNNCTLRFAYVLFVLFVSQWKASFLLRILDYQAIFQLCVCTHLILEFDKFLEDHKMILRHPGQDEDDDDAPDEEEVIDRADQQVCFVVLVLSGPYFSQVPNKRINKFIFPSRYAY